MGLFIFCLLEPPYLHWPPNPPRAFYPPFICPSITLDGHSRLFPKHNPSNLLNAPPSSLLSPRSWWQHTCLLFYWSSFCIFVLILMGLVLTPTFTSQWDSSRFKCILVTRLIVVFFMWPQLGPSLLMNLFLRVPLDFCSRPSTLLKNIWSSS